MHFNDKRNLRVRATLKNGSSHYLVGTREYIERNYEPNDRLAIVIRNHLSGETIQRLASAEKIASPEFQAWLRHKNARGADIYISQNSFRSDARTRSKVDVDQIRHVYLDLDENGQDALIKIRESAVVPEPSFVINTSPHKYQVIWKVADISPAEAEALQKAMVVEFGADRAATDSTRVLRLPGFQNKKYEQDYRVEAYSGSDGTYSLPDFRISVSDRRFEAQSFREAKRHPRASTKATQSERDWAHAKQQLVRGELPERLVEAFVRSRQDKSSPDYYARQTVSRAYISVALKRGDNPDEIERVVAQFATHQPHPGRYVRQTLAEMKSERQGRNEINQPGGASRTP